jgi:hypothetical protein
VAAKGFFALLLTPGGGKRRSHLGTAENPTPNGQPQRRGKDAPQGRMARSLTRREDWPRDAVGVRRPGGDPLPRPDDQPAQPLQLRPLPGSVSSGLLEAPSSDATPQDQVQPRCADLIDGPGS